MSGTKKLTPEEAAAFLGVKSSTLAAWRHKKKGPRYSKLGSKVMYDQDDLETWFFSCCVYTKDTAPQLRGRK